MDHGGPGGGDIVYTDRGELRSVVWELAGGVCEWCRLVGAPDIPATELAHIVSRGMGGSRYRDTVANTFAACSLHARASDYEGEYAPDEWRRLTGSTRYDTAALVEAISAARRSSGWRA